EVPSEVRPHLVGVLNVGAAVPCSGIQELLTALVIAGRRAQKKVGDVVSSFTSVKSKVSVGRTSVPLIDLQITEPPAKFQRVRAVYFGKPVGNVPSVIGLKRRQRIHTYREVVEIFGGHGLRKARRPRRIDAQGTYAGNKTEVGKFCEAGLGFVGGCGGSKKAQSELVHGCCAERLVVAHDELLRPRRRFAGKPRHAGIQGI